jgi:hypothetical protein
MLTPSFGVFNSGVCKHYDLRSHLLNLAIFLDENVPNGSDKTSILTALETLSNQAHDVLRKETHL